MLRVLMVGDVYGSPGRRVLETHLPTLRSRFDFVVVNMENAAGGLGVHRAAVQGALEAGADCLTLGNHTWHHRDIFALLSEERWPLLRPLNYSDPQTPGLGWRTFDVAGSDGPERLTVVNLLGRIFMEPVGHPLLAMDQLLAQPNLGTVLVDFHAEATSEKAALAWYLDGRVAAVIGTHTHVPTADERLLPGGTAFQTDVGFTGPHESVIGSVPQSSIAKLLTERPQRFPVAAGRAEFNAVSLELHQNRALSIQRYRYLEPSLAER